LLAVPSLALCCVVLLSAHPIPHRIKRRNRNEEEKE
jgi:hypothetical protein